MSDHPVQSPRVHDRRSILLGAVATLAVCALATDRPLWKPGQVFGPDENVQIAEAQAIRQGRLDLPERRWDTACKDGKVYSYFPPMFTFVAAATVPLFDGVPHPLIVAMAALVPLLAYLLFVRLARSVTWGCLLAIGMTMGTSLWPVIDKMLRGASPYSVNHVLATIGLLLFLLAYDSERRYWLGGVGLLIAALSRQMTLAYALPLAWAACRSKPGGTARSRPPRMVPCAILALAPVVTMTMNAAKFGSPFDSGYMHNYVDRDDAFAADAREYGLFSTHYLARNAYYLNFGFPRLHRISIGDESRWYLRPDEMGVGIWWTSPILLWILIDGKSILRDRRKLMLLTASLAVFVALLFWHGTGSVQRGFHRYSLDFVPVLYALAVPGCLATSRRRWWTAGFLVWSLLYFAVLLPRPNIRIW